MADRPLAPRRSIVALVSLLGAAALCAAQQPAASPSPPAREEQEPVRVYTEEVRLPVVAYDDRGRFDPTLGADDVLVLEDGVPQRVRSVRRLPANVLLVFDLGGQVAATHAAGATREAALRLASALREGDSVAVIQNGGARVELLQDWTTDAAAVGRVLKTKFFSANRSRLSECLKAAAAKLAERPTGSTHVVVFTDGLEAQTRDEIRSDEIAKESLRALVAAQASVHVFGFASLVEKAVKYRNSPVSAGGGANGTMRVVIDTDAEMRNWFKRYARATKGREEQLQQLARESGGRVLLPSNVGEVSALADGVARDIGAQYVVTYAPLRPFVGGAESERRRADVSARRQGLRLFTLRSVVVAPRR